MALQGLVPAHGLFSSLTHEAVVLLHAAAAASVHLGGGSLSPREWVDLRTQAVRRGDGDALRTDQHPNQAG